MHEANVKKEFWLPYSISCAISFGLGVALHQWLLVLLFVFISMLLSIGIAFSKKHRRLAGAFGGATIGLGLALIFLIFGPIKFYGN